MKRFALFSVVLVLILSIMTACGGQAAPADQSSDQVTAQQAPAESAVVEQALPEADTKATVDGLIGSWKDVTAADRFANITKTDSGYEYEDNEGKYPATFENGVLKVKVSDTDTADVYIDAKTGHMLTVYQGGQSEFEKK